MGLQCALLRRLVYQVAPHPVAFAYRPGLSVVECANQHLRSDTVIRLDIADFFPSIKERWVYRALSDSRITPPGHADRPMTRLEAYELAVLCTVRPNGEAAWINRGRHLSWQPGDGLRRLEYTYAGQREGFLPQGAPTSGALSNLVMQPLDEKIYEIAARLGLRYTRYSDDLYFSSRRRVATSSVDELIGAVRRVLAGRDLHLNDPKTRVARSGTRRAVLGILVDGHAARLPRERHREIDLHLRGIDRHGIHSHSRYRQFEETDDFERYLRGLISWVSHVEPARGARYLDHLHRSLRRSVALVPASDAAGTTMEQQARESIDRLLAEGREYRLTSSYKDFLRFMGSFKQYAPFNVAMIHLQRRGARFVLTDSKWRSEFRRVLKPDAQPLVIMQPKGPYMVVYDVGDTEPLPGAPVLPREMTNPMETTSSLSHEEARRLWLMTVDNATRDGVRVSLVNNNPNCAGSIRWASTRQVISRPGPRGKGREQYDVRCEVVVSRHLSDVDKYVTLVHELAHLYCGHIGARADDTWPDRVGTRQREEIEAESCAYMVMRRHDDTYRMGAYLLGYFDREGELPDDVSLQQVISVTTRILQMGEKRLSAPPNRGMTFRGRCSERTGRKPTCIARLDWIDRLSRTPWVQESNRTSSATKTFRIDAPGRHSCSRHWPP